MLFFLVYILVYIILSLVFYFCTVMSDRKAKQYNLRSGKQGRVHMPIHKQLCEDREFLTEMLGKQSDPADTSFQDSDVSVSDSDLNCSGLLSQSDNEAHSSITDSRTYKKFVTKEKYLPLVGTLVRIRLLKTSLTNKSFISSQF